jgi:hypothetical protein
MARTHIGQLARGERRDFFYGDPSLPTSDDLERLRRARALFFHAWKRGLATSFIGASNEVGTAGLSPGAAGRLGGAECEPGVAPWHGWLTGEGHAGIAYLVNTRFHPVTVTIDLMNLASARVLYYDGSVTPPVQAHRDVLTIRLAPEQAALVGLGEYADAEWEIGNDPEAGLPGEVIPASLSFQRQGETLVGTVESPGPRDAELWVVAEAFDAPERSYQRAEPFVFGRQNTKTSRDMTPRAHEELAISVRAGERELEPTEQIPAVPIWSGTSWVARRFETTGEAVTVRVRQHFPDRKRLFATAYWVASGSARTKGVGR